MGVNACLKGPNDLPPIYGNEQWEQEINTHIKNLNQLKPDLGAPLLIDQDWVLKAVVRADDESGNFSEKIIIEDSLAGIAMLINEKSLFTRFPIGKKIYLRLKGLYIGNRYGTFELGSSPVADNSGVLQVSPIRPQDINSHLMASTQTWNLNALPTTINAIRQAPEAYLNRLIVLDSVQFNNPYYDQYYASTTAASNVRLVNCQKDSIDLRTSNYAQFQSENLPIGKGKITAIVGRYKDQLQLMIRTSNDVKFNELRCDGSGNTAPQYISIDSLRKMYTGTDISLGNYYIRGTVNIDGSQKNINAQNIILQEHYRGIELYCNGDLNLLPKRGDSVEINISGATLTRYQGILELSNIKTSKIKRLDSNKAITPQNLSIALLLSHFDQYESVLIKINNAKITSGSSTWAGNKTLSDATGFITLYTNSDATFASYPIPSTTKNFQAVARYFNTTPELIIRHPDIDVQ